MTRAPDRIGIVGGGRMGRGIALSFICAGHRAAVIDLKDRPAENFSALEADIRASLRADLSFLASAEALPENSIDHLLARVEVIPARQAAAAIAASAMIFEAVPETEAAKQSCFALLDRHAAADCLIASTTSTMHADKLGSLLHDPKRFCNVHWLNPAHLIPLVEISPCAGSDPERVNELKELLRGIGKIPVLCKASPGYIVPRIQALAMNEAARLVEEGVASAEDIDLAIRVGFGLRYSVLGLLEFIDWGGGDILYYASNYLSKTIDPERFACPDIIRRNMEAGRRGLRDGQGFYDFRAIDQNEYRQTRMRSYLGLLRHLHLMPEGLS